jgi:hypothetical protein
VFIRILRGQAYDGAATLAEVNRWRRELGAGVLGWRRLTAGIGDGGELVLALRYDTEAAARRDRDRPELAAWQAAADRHLTGPGHWYDCPVVHTMKEGDAGEAASSGSSRAAWPTRSGWPPCGPRSSGPCATAPPTSLG